MVSVLTRLLAGWPGVLNPGSPNWLWGPGFDLVVPRL
jgi:hypothetical protein